MNGYIIEKYNRMTGAYTCHRLCEEAAKRNITLDIVGVHDCILTPEGLENCGMILEKRDFIINRYKWGAIKDKLNSLGKRCYNSIDCYDIYKNKYQQVKRLRSAEFRIPDYVLASAALPFDYLCSRLTLPFVAKALENSMGREIFLIENKEDYLRLFQEYGPDREWLFEEFIASSKGKDLRLFAIRGEAVACMMRKSQGDFRANVALGASVEKVSITPSLRIIAEDICTQTGLDFVGIDLLPGKEGFYLCEINVMPGLEGIEGASGKNIAGEIIDMIKEDFVNDQTRR